MSVSIKRWMCAGVVILFALGLVRAANFKFQQQEQVFRAAAREQLQKLGLSEAAAKARYPTPEIALVSAACLLPGATGEVVVKGKFVPGSKFIIENDSIEIVKENLTPAEYRASLRAASGIGPQTASLRVISPVTAITAQHYLAARIGGKYEWTMEAANGWKIVARSKAEQACADASRDAYEVAFYRKGETAPFEKRAAELYYSMYERANYRFSISREDPAAQSEQDQAQALAQKMSDPKLSAAEREKVMAQFQALMQRMQASMKTRIDPAYIKQQQAKELEFGCQRIELQVPGRGSYTGELGCAEKVGRRIPLTGTIALVK